MIQLIIRGICCPAGISGLDNIYYSIVVAIWNTPAFFSSAGEDEEFYFLLRPETRNLNRRGNGLPCARSVLCKQLKWLLDSQLRDTAKSSLMLSDGSYRRKQGTLPFDSQSHFMEYSPHLPVEPLPEKPHLVSRLRSFVEKYLQ